METWKRGNSLSLSWRIVLRGAGIGMAVLLALAAAAAYLISREVVALEWMDYAVVAILLLGGFAGAAGAGQGTALDSLSTAGCIWLILLCVNAVFFGFEMSGLPAVLLPVVGGAGAGVLLRDGWKKPGKRRRRKYRHR